MTGGSILGLALVLAVLGSACGSDDEGSVVDGMWIVAEIDGQPIVPGENTESVPFLEFDGDEMTGSFGCNDGRASLRVEGDALVVDEAGSEDEACASVTVSFAENAITEVLGSGRIGLTRADDRMVWVAVGRQIVLTAASEPPP